MKIVAMDSDGHPTLVISDPWDENAIACFDALRDKGWTKAEAIEWVTTYCIMADPLAFKMFVEQ